MRGGGYRCHANTLLLHTLMGSVSDIFLKEEIVCKCFVPFLSFSRSIEFGFYVWSKELYILKYTIAAVSWDAFRLIRSFGM